MLKTPIIDFVTVWQTQWKQRRRCLLNSVWSCFLSVGFRIVSHKNHGHTVQHLITDFHACPSQYWFLPWLIARAPWGRMCLHCMFYVSGSGGFWELNALLKGWDVSAQSSKPLFDLARLRAPRGSRHERLSVICPNVYCWRNCPPPKKISIEESKMHNVLQMTAA